MLGEFLGENCLKSVLLSLDLKSVEMTACSIIGSWVSKSCSMFLAVS